MIDVIIDVDLDKIAKKVGGLKYVGAGTELSTNIRVKEEKKAVKFAQEIARKWDGVRVQVRGVIFEKGSIRGRARLKKEAI